VVKIQDSFVLDVSDFGAIVDVVFAIPALLSDGIGVPFPRRWDYLYLNPYSRDVCHIPGINE
jgi:hypothetical protein